MAMTLEEVLSKQAADLAAISPALVRKAVDALARSSHARAAADALVYLSVGTTCTMFAAAFLTIFADLACASGWGCTPAYVLSEIADYLSTPVLLLLPPALVLFFLRAAGCRTKAAADAESLIVKNDEEPTLLSPSPLALAILWLFIGSASMGIISFLLFKCGHTEISDLLGYAALLCTFMWEALVYVRAAVALWRMNPGQSNMVAAE
ncbi:hypothetical protein ACQJBY_072092 [Aegilops geniculata]